MHPPKDIEARTFLAALLATVALLAKPLLWGAFITAIVLLMVSEPLS